MKTNLRTLMLWLLTVTAFTTVRSQGPTITSTVLVQPCNSNGQVSVTVTGLTPPISYTYTNWSANQTIVHSNINAVTDLVTGLPAYQSLNWNNPNVWGVSASNGVNTVNGNFTLNPPFLDSIKVFPATCPALSTVTANNFVGGTAPFSCVWTNTTSNQSFSANPAAVPNGIYMVTITDGAGCVVTSAPGFSGSTIYVTNYSNISVNINGTAANCTNGTATVTATGGTGPYTYLWNNSAVTQGISGLVQGNYNCQVTDALGCQATGFYNLQQAITLNFNSSITNATCLQNNGGVIAFVNGGTAPYSFLWSNGATTQNISNLLGGQQYAAQITDANGCTGMGYAYVNSSSPILVTYTATPSSCTAATGSATLTSIGGLAPYTVLWYLFPSNQIGTSITGKPSGSYNFKVTDANGCISTGSAFIPPISGISANINNSSVVCPAITGNLQATATSQNPPLTYLWSTGGTASSISGAPLGAHSCTITNAVGCKVVKTGLIVQSNPISVGFSVTTASCMYSNNGAVTAIAMGGASPYTYTWNVGQTGATATALTPGNYYVYVTDANGCHNSYNNTQVNVGYNPLNNSCYCTITGTVYADANSNCIKNTGENGIPNVAIHCSGYGYAYTNSNGVYSFYVPTGTYTVSQTVQQIYPLATCQNNNIVVSVVASTNCVSPVNFANNVLPIHDLHIINTSMNWPTPGNAYQQRVIIQNDGTLAENNIKFGYAHTGQFAYANSGPWVLSQQNAITYPNWYSITSGFPALNTGSSTATFINYNVPANTPLGTVVSFNDSVAHAPPISTIWLTDNTPWNNVKSHQVVVLGAFDPNFKEVTPKGSGPAGNITTSDSILTYVVHFQNEGTYFAQNVVVVDTLDSDLNLSSLRPGYSDHNYSVTMSDNGVVKFDFKNIKLPWKSAYGDVLSSGMFTYTIKLKKNLPVGREIKNKAAIYFDFNEPIITNTTLNTIWAPVGLQEFGLKADNSIIYPNPATHYFNLMFDSPEDAKAILNIYDISGREVSSTIIEMQTGGNNVQGNVSQLQNGIYIVQLKSENVIVSKKLIVTK